MIGIAQGLSRRLALGVASMLVLTASGCLGPQRAAPAPGFRPNEDVPVSLTEYIVNPPDVLVIQMEAIPSQDQVIKPGDFLTISEPNPLVDHPLNDAFLVSADGFVDLGHYGKVQVLGQTVAEAKKSIDAHLIKEELDTANTSVSLVGIAPIDGEYLVRPDGMVKLGFYGTVHVAGKTLSEAEQAVKEHLETHHGLVNPKISVDVATYNSMVYYVISDGAGAGDQVTRIPVTGQETVLDAMSELGGIPFTGSKRHIWVARPIPGDAGAAEILPVDWIAISKHGSMATNYQIMPGDRVYIKADKLSAADTFLAKLIAPVERVLGTITLFDISIDSVRGQNSGGGQGGF